MNSLAMLAVSWEPELRGYVVVIIAAVVLIGGSYLVVGTNLGARLGFLVVLAGLFGWMAAMGVIWWTYGIGLTGELTPLSVGIYQFFGQFDKEWTYLFATAVMGAVPVIICFMYMERWLVKGLTSGGVK